MKDFARNQLPLIVWCALIFWLSSINRIPTIKFFLPPDKVAHTSFYFVLCWFSRRAFRFQNASDWLRKYSLLIAFLFATLYGVSDEIHQRFVPGRTFDYFDMLADATGAGIFVLALTVTTWWKKKAA